MCFENKYTPRRKPVIKTCQDVCSHFDCYETSIILVRMYMCICIYLYVSEEKGRGGEGGRKTKSLLSCKATVEGSEAIGG